MEGILELCAGLPVREVAEGEELLAEGGSSGFIYVLVGGVMAIEKGGLLVARVSDPGAFVGEISTLLGAPHTARVYAATACRVHVMPATELTDNPAILLGVARLLAARVHAMTSYLVDLRHQYADEETHLGLMAQVLSELTAARPSSASPGSDRGDVYDCCEVYDG